MTCAGRPVTAAKSGDRDRRGVAGENCVLRQNRIERTEDLSLQIEALRCSFDGNLGLSQSFARDGRLNASEGGFDIGLGNLALRGFAAKISANLRERTIQKALVHIAQHNLKSGAGKDVGDAGAHGPGADDSDFRDIGHGALRSDASGSVAGQAPHSLRLRKQLRNWRQCGSGAIGLEVTLATPPRLD